MVVGASFIAPFGNLGGRVLSQSNTPVEILVSRLATSGLSTTSCTCDLIFGSATSAPSLMAFESTLPEPFINTS